MGLQSQKKYGSFPEQTLTETRFRRLADKMFLDVWSRLFPPQIDTKGLATRIEENLITPEDTDVPDCGTCGACCAAFVCVSTAPEDDVPEQDCWAIIEDVNPDLLIDRYIRRRKSDLACCELEGVVGDKVSCRIYEDRPGMCRTFEAGSDRCHAVRRAYGIEAFLTIEEMAEARQKLESASRKEGDRGERISNVFFRSVKGSTRKEILVNMGQGDEHRVHSYDPGKETWFKAELEGLWLDELSAYIRQKSK